MRGVKWDHDMVRGNRGVVFVGRSWGTGHTPKNIYTFCKTYGDGATTANPTLSSLPLSLLLDTSYIYAHLSHAKTQLRKR